MKIAVVSESPADEAAIKILIDAIAGIESELFPIRARPGGWTRVFDLLPNMGPPSQASLLKRRLLYRRQGRLADNIDELEQLFPSGFGCFLADVRNWFQES